MADVDPAALADELAIRSVVARLAHLADYGDVDDILIRDGRTTPTVRSTGRYEDEFVKTDAGWKLASRTVRDHVRAP